MFIFDKCTEFLQLNQATATCSSEVVDSHTETLCPGQEMVFEFGQAFALCHLHADLVFLLCKAGALTVKQELGPEFIVRIITIVRLSTMLHSHINKVAKKMWYKFTGQPLPNSSLGNPAGSEDSESLSCGLPPTSSYRRQPPRSTTSSQ